VGVVGVADEVGTPCPAAVTVPRLCPPRTAAFAAATARRMLGRIAHAAPRRVLRTLYYKALFPRARRDTAKGLLGARVFVSEARGALLETRGNGHGEYGGRAQPLVAYCRAGAAAAAAA
jgi:hypothetical protein